MWLDPGRTFPKAQSATPSCLRKRKKPAWDPDAGGDLGGVSPGLPPFTPTTAHAAAPRPTHTGFESGSEGKGETAGQQLKGAWAWENAVGAKPGRKRGQVSTAVTVLSEVHSAGERD